MRNVANVNHKYFRKGTNDETVIFFLAKRQLAGLIYDLFINKCHFWGYLRKCHLILNMLYPNPAKSLIERLKSLNEIFLLKIFKCLPFFYQEKIR